MMNPLDIIVLASTKLRTHRIRTGISVVIAGLIFGLIVMILAVIQGVFTSIDSYSKVGLNDRTLMAVSRGYSQYFNVYEHQNDQEFIAEIEAAYSADIAHKAEVAKKHGFVYDAASQDPSPIEVDKASGQKIISADGMNSQIVADLAAGRNVKKEAKFSMEKYLSPYKSLTYRGFLTPVVPDDGYLTYMKSGQENQKVSEDRIEDSLIGTGSGAQLMMLDASVTKPFIINESYKPSSGEIPVIMPVSDAQKILGLTKLAPDATNEQRRDRLRYIRSHVNDISASFCYRNSASRALLAQAQSQQAELDRVKDKTNYIPPDVIYDSVDDNNCQAVTVKSDKRSNEQKAIEAKMEAYQKDLGIWQGDPEQYMLTVRAVGISGDDDMTGSVSVAGIINSLLNSSLGYGTWPVPADLFAQLPASSRPDAVFVPGSGTKRNLDIFDNGSKTYLVEFGDVDEARALLKRTGAYDGMQNEIWAVPFGSSVLVVDEAREIVNKVLFWVLAVVGGIAVVILGGVIGRTLADSRRESAVFRAIGATRLDIAGIYGTYALLLALRIAVFAFAVGLGAALAVDLAYSDTATLGAQIAYAAVDTNIKFHLIDIASVYLLVVLGVIVLVGILASIIPIILSARRNPINDMRDEG